MAISKSSAEYYNLEKVAEVLSVSAAEVNRLREQSKLRGFRDGSNWKFLKEDIHTYLAESIKARSGSSNGHKPGESDFDLGGGASPSSFDLLMEDAALPHDSDLVSVSPSAPPSSDLDLAALDNEDDLALAEETQVSSLVVPKKIKKPEEPKSEILRAVQEDNDSSALILEPAPGSFALDDDASVLEASGSSPQLGLAGDSGFDVLVAGEEENVLVAEEDDNLLEVEEKAESVASIVEEFALEPSAKAAFSDDSESSSQVIAIDAFSEAGQDVAPFGQEFSDFVGFDSGIHAAAVPPPPSSGGDPFASDAPAFDDMTAPAPVSAKKPAVVEEEYSTGTLVSLVLALVVMLLPGTMLLDTMVRMWSWGEPFVLNSMLMSTIAGWFGL